MGTAPTPSGAELRLSRGEAGGLAPPPLHAWPPETVPPLEKDLAPGWLLCTIKRYTTKAGCMLKTHTTNKKNPLQVHT